MVYFKESSLSAIFFCLLTDISSAAASLAKMPNDYRIPSGLGGIKFCKCQRLQLVQKKEYPISGNISDSLCVNYAEGNFEPFLSFHSFAHEMDVRDKIVEKSASLFMQFGIRTVTMDDIAKDLSISKKTIYHYFKDKRELVNTMCRVQLDMEEQRFAGTVDESENAVHELILVSKCLRESMEEMKVNIMNELQKFYPDAWKMYMDFKSGVMKEAIMDVIKRGQGEGLFRQELDPELIAVLRMEQVETFIMGNVFPKDKYTLTEVQLQLFDHFIHGLFTIEGHQLFNQYNTTNVKQYEALN